MFHKWPQRLRPWVPNIELRIPHVEKRKRLAVRCREHLGLILRGAKAYEPEYVNALRNLIEPGQTVFDVGANIGFYSVLFSEWVGPRGKVIAYEPDPENLSLLRRNLHLNQCKNVLVRPVALGNESGLQDFSVDRVTHLTGHLGRGPTYGATIFGSANEDLISVATSTLDDEVREFDAPHVIKMDIEGGEYDALAGGASLLKNEPPIIVSEMNRWLEPRDAVGTRAAQAARFLQSCDYRLWNLDTGDAAELDSMPWMLLALPKSRHDLGAQRFMVAGRRS
jgi:FkbM family methyltransferase